VVDEGLLRATPGSGRFLARDAGAAAAPTGRRGPEFDPEQNFGAYI
jgi:dihydropyrimidinase